MCDEFNPIIIDNGSYSCKFGFSGEEKPEVDWDYRGMYPVNDVEYPIKCGEICNWDHMEALWNSILSNKLKINLKDHPILFTDSCFNPKINREKITEIMFEKLEIPSLCFANPTILSMYGSGLTDGIILDSGHGITSAVAFTDRIPIKDSHIKFNAGGSDLTFLLKNILKFDGSLCEVEKHFKEKYCYVALDFDKEYEIAKKDTHLNNIFPYLYDNRGSIGAIKCPEALFNFSLINKDLYSGIHEIIYKSIIKIPGSLRKDLTKNIILSGGNTKFPRIAERFKNEIESIFLKKCEDYINVNIIERPNREYLTWIGGSIISSLSSFNLQLCTKMDYKENGMSILNEKSFTFLI